MNLKNRTWCLPKIWVLVGHSVQKKIKKRSENKVLKNTRKEIKGENFKAIDRLLCSFIESICCF